MRKYKVKVSYTLSGTVDCRASSREEAKDIVSKNLGFNINNVHSTYDSNSKDEEGIIDWNIGLHPSKETIK